MVRLQWFAALAFAMLAIPAAAHANECTALRGGSLGEAQVRSATPVSGVFTAPRGAGAFENLPSFCRVTLTARPSSSSNVTIEVWLPAREAWNGRLLGTGNGGFAGGIAFPALADGVRRGFATANTDMGTFPTDLFPDYSYEAGIGAPDMVRDWGHRATHAMTEAARAVIARYYGQAPHHAYFAGCSTGGHQALMEAQRFPEDYDGVLAGAPGANRTHLHAAFNRAFQMLSRDPSLFADAGKFALLRDAQLAACGARDGGAAGDAYLNNPAACRFDPRELACAQAGAGAPCLSDAEVAALREFYSGVRNPRTGAVIYPAWSLGSEIGLRINGAPRAAPEIGRADGLLRWALGATWDARTFDFDGDMARVDQAIGADVNALSADLRAFQARGGRLMLYHGWEDPIVSAHDTILYLERLGRAHGRQTESFARLFMAPGVSHCAGGPGPDVFGGQAGSTAPEDPSRDMLAALVRWVELGEPPETIVAAKRGADGAVTRERPLCAYPRVARYDGRNDVDAASSFRCVAARRAQFEWPGAEYLENGPLGDDDS